MSDVTNVFLWELNYQKDIHSILKRSEIEAERDFMNNSLYDSEDLKQSLARLFVSMRLRVRAKIDAIHRRLQETGVYFPAIPVYNSRSRRR